MQFDLSVVARRHFFKDSFLVAVTVVHITDTYTLFPAVLTTQIFLFFGGGGLKGRVPVYAMKTYRGSGGMAVLVTNLATV